MSRDALVVGINTYRHLSPLNAPASDADAIAPPLRQTLLLDDVVQAGDTLQVKLQAEGWERTQLASAVRESQAAARATIILFGKPKG